MSMQVEKGVVVLDDNTAQWLKQYREALAKIKEWQEVANEQCGITKAKYYAFRKSLDEDNKIFRDKDTKKFIRLTTDTMPFGKTN